MLTPLISLVATSIALILFTTLTSHEARRGVRYFGSFRSHVDFYLLKVRHSWNVGIRNWGRFFVRQIIHYFFHTMLTGTIKSLTVIEDRLRSVARTNRALARKSEKERTSKNKLEEIALHKLEMTLTDEEKRIRKQKSLEG
jgi:hypothetical protein